MKNKDSFTTFIQELLTYNKVFVCYNLPNSPIVEVLVQKDDLLYTTGNFSEEAFIFAPFKDISNSPIIPIWNAYSYTFLLDDIKINNNIFPQNSTFSSSSSQEDYALLIEKAKSDIQSHNLEKVVLSRRLVTDYEKDNIPQVVCKLLNIHTTAFTYLWHHPKVGVWMGATPEKLISVNQNKLYTMALAGTQVADSASDLKWTDKEVQEQKIVSEYINKALRKAKIPITKSEPFNLKAGKIWHICTQFSGVLTHFTTLKSLVEILHPTPAVAGIPKKKAIDFILENESYNRSYYTGFLGPINRNNKSHLFVNLRCMQLKNNKAFIYVGGGITADSNAQLEWQETEAKSKTLIHLL